MEALFPLLLLSNPRSWLILTITVSWKPTSTVKRSEQKKKEVKKEDNYFENDVCVINFFVLFLFDKFGSDELCCIIVL